MPANPVVDEVEFRCIVISKNSEFLSIAVDELSIFIHVSIAILLAVDPCFMSALPISSVRISVPKPLTVANFI